MDVSIRHRYNHASTVVSPSGVVFGKPLCGNHIPAKGRDGQLHYRPFGGVIDDAISGNHQCVKLVNISDFFWNDMGMGQGCSIPRHHVVKGCYFNNCYYIAIKNDLPVHFEDAE
jgi:hypothetical protein